MPQHRPKSPLKFRVQRFLTRQIAKLPGSLVLKMAGGEPLVVGGRSMDPHLQLVAWSGRNNTKLWELPPEKAQRAVSIQFQLMGQPTAPGVKCRELTIPSPEGHAIPARAYIPDKQDPKRPPLVFFHMGGGVIGDLGFCHHACSIFAQRARVAVVSVDYRLAPQHRFPAGLNDAIAAYHYVAKHGHEFGSKVPGAAVGGGSMGGTFAASIAQSHRSEGRASGPAPVLQLLLYPLVDLNKLMPSHQTYAQNFVLDLRLGQWFMKHYLSSANDRCDPRVSIGLCEDLSGLPPTVMITAGHDPLVDEGDEYAERMKKAGVSVQHHRFDALVHGFTGFTGISPGCRKACEAIGDKLDEAYQKLDASNKAEAGGTNGSSSQSTSSRESKKAVSAAE